MNIYVYHVHVYYLISDVAREVWATSARRPISALFPSTFCGRRRRRKRKRKKRRDSNFNTSDVFHLTRQLSQFPGKEINFRGALCRFEKQSFGICSENHAYSSEEEETFPPLPGRKERRQHCTDEIVQISSHLFAHLTWSYAIVTYHFHGWSMP